MKNQNECICQNCGIVIPGMKFEEIAYCGKCASAPAPEFENWEGIDVDIETSLMEYNVILRKLIIKTPQKHDYQYIVKEWSNLHDVKEWSNLRDNTHSQDFYFHVGGVDESYIDEKIKDLCGDSFYNFIGCKDFEFLESTFERKVYDLLSYFGYEDIFGCDYSNPDTKEELAARFPELDFLTEQN